MIVPGDVNSLAYWEKRYSEGGTSGSGSTGENASFKAGFLNTFVAAHAITTVAEHGCGDGRQLQLADYPRYAGWDPSPTARALCQRRVEGDQRKRIVARPPKGELVVSLDVIYHLVEDPVYEDHLRQVFASATRFVILYTTDSGRKDYPGSAPHVRHRPVTADINVRFPAFRLVETVENPVPELGGCDFYVYERVGP